MYMDPHLHMARALDVGDTVVYGAEEAVVYAILQAFDEKRDPQLVFTSIDHGKMTEFTVRKGNLETHTSYGKKWGIKGHSRNKHNTSVAYSVM